MTDELKRLAEASTPGPWIAHISNSERWSQVIRPENGNWPYDNVAYIQEMHGDKCTRPGGHMANAAYIAAASPDAILALLAENARLRESLLNVARKAEMLKQECGSDPESPQAIRNGRYMHLSYIARQALKAQP